MTEADVQRLLTERKITHVEPDPVTALEEIATARRHIAAAAAIAELDPTLAFTGLYDAMRKAIQAHMRANGYRVSKGAGGHRKIGEYALAAPDALDVGPHLDEYLPSAESSRGGRLVRDLRTRVPRHASRAPSRHSGTDDEASCLVLSITASRALAFG
jgi:hypothetical protein